MLTRTYIWRLAPKWAPRGWTRQRHVERAAPPVWLRRVKHRAVNGMVAMATAAQSRGRGDLLVGRAVACCDLRPVARRDP